ncbi:centaurin-gamma-1A isoform X4 [Hydra vulgaris]|uniref:Centaurin-gamma-1A isoform X4 n=1 Tax=Hydra vulgaris TaxID=6087 RepID=A0ABM4CYD7_HYDVU
MPATSLQYGNVDYALKEEARFSSFYKKLLSAQELLENIANISLRTQFRDIIAGIEDDFTQDSDFTIPKSSLYNTMRLGIVGGAQSRKSFLIQSFLSNKYSKEECYAKRFKKTIFLNDISYLLLLRDETGPPDQKFSEWCDGVVLVFSYNDELSFNVLSGYYAKMIQQRSDKHLPCLLVAIQPDEEDFESWFVPEVRIKKFLSDHPKCDFFSISMLTGDSISSAFEAAVLKMAAVDSPSLAVASTFISSFNASPERVRLGSIKKKNIRNMFSLKAEKKDDIVLDDVGSGRHIPIKQGYIYKKSQGGLKGSIKEWKKKYVVITTEQIFSYYPSMKDYIDDNGAKSISLIHSSVKTHGKKNVREKTGNQKVLEKHPPTSQLTANNCAKSSMPIEFDLIDSKDFEDPDDHEIDGSPTIHTSVLIERSKSDGRDYTSSSMRSSQNFDVFPTKRKNRKPANRHKSCEIDYKSELNESENSSTVSPRKISTTRKKNQTSVFKEHLVDGKFGVEPEGDGCGFSLINFDGKIWEFECNSTEERDSWVHHIENEILNAFQDQTFQSERSQSTIDEFEVIQKRLISVVGNNFCADCSAPDPVWASMNLGILICIECSGVHRNLGSHLSRVRSLYLDEWQNETLSIMLLLGNTYANSIWQNRLQGKPITPQSTRDEREKWITGKYERKEMIKQLSIDENKLTEVLIGFVHKKMFLDSYFMLVHSTKNQVNKLCKVEGYSHKVAPLHLSCANCDIALTQLLLWYGANPRVLDELGYNPLFYARKSDSKMCIDLLLQYGCSYDTTR